MEAIREERKKTPEQKIWLGIIQQAFEDAFELVWVITYLWQKYKKQGTGFILDIVLKRVTTQVQQKTTY